MPSETLWSLPAVRKQHLLVELYVCKSIRGTVSVVADEGLCSASLKYVCPSGVYVSITPGNPAIWVGVMFIRRGKDL